MCRSLPSRWKIVLAMLLMAALPTCKRSPVGGTKEIGPPPPGVKGYREVFFATDRKLTDKSPRFGNEASDKEELQFGRAIISVPESHQRGVIERPWRLFSVSLPEDAQRHIVIVKRESLSSSGLLDGIKKAIDASPEQSAFVFIHGFNSSFDDALLRTGQLAWDLHFQGPAVTYSWPSAARTAAYVSDVDMADWTSVHLADFLAKLRRATGARRIHLIAHSMGSRVLSMALDRLHSNLDMAVRFQEVVLAAPDLNNRVLAQLSVALRSESDHVTLYTSGRDLALSASALLRTGGERAGGRAERLPPLPDFDVIDATRAKASLLGHTYFAEDTLLLNDLSLLIRQRLRPDQRSITLERVGSVWVFRP